MGRSPFLAWATTTGTGPPPPRRLPPPPAPPLSPPLWSRFVTGLGIGLSLFGKGGKILVGNVAAPPGEGRSGNEQQDQPAQPSQRGGLARLDGCGHRRGAGLYETESVFMNADLPVGRARRDEYSRIRSGWRVFPTASRLRCSVWFRQASIFAAGRGDASGHAA